MVAGVEKGGEPVRLLLGDCLETMAGMESDSIDAIVTDPPFGIGFHYVKGAEDNNTPDGYWEWLSPRYAQMLRVLRPGGFCAIWQAQMYYRYFWEWFGADIHIYCAAKNFVQLRKTAINYGYDPVVMFYKAGASPLRPKPQRNVDFFVANTASMVSNPNRPERAHPCPRPIDQAVEIVRNFTLPGGIVLDPFMGSGTTGVAAVQEGRDFIGIEREAEYLAIAEARIEHAQGKQMAMAL